MQSYPSVSLTAYLFKRICVRLCLLCYNYLHCKSVQQSPEFESPRNKTTILSNGVNLLHLGTGAPFSSSVSPIVDAVQLSSRNNSSCDYCDSTSHPFPVSSPRRHVTLVQLLPAWLRIAAGVPQRSGGLHKGGIGLSDLLNCDAQVDVSSSRTCSHDSGCTGLLSSL